MFGKRTGQPGAAPAPLRPAPAPAPAPDPAPPPATSSVFGGLDLSRAVARHHHHLVRLQRSRSVKHMLQQRPAREQV